MSDRLNIAGYLSDRARTNPKTIAIIDPKHKVFMTYDELNILKNRWAIHFKNKGICKGMRSLVLIRPGVELIAITFALLEIGAIPIMIDPGMGLRNFLKCVKRSEPKVLIGISLAHWFRRVFKKSFKSVKIRIVVKKGKIPAVFENKTQKVKKLDPEIHDEIAGIVFTSGSTGAPKGVLYSHKLFNAQIKLLRDVFKITPEEVDFPMLPIFALFNPALGLTTIVPDMNSSKPANADAAKIVRDLNKYQATNSFGSPVLWKKIADYCESENIRLISLKRILMAGCSVPIGLIKRFKLVAPNAQVHTPYGSTEALPVASISTKKIFETDNTTSVNKGTCIGQAIEGVSIKIIKCEEGVLKKLNDSVELNKNEIGEIIVKGDVVTEQYDNLPEATAKAKISEDGETWHRMGDLGYLDEKDFLWFCGRKAEVVHTKKGPMYTDCCEGIINQHPRVNRSALIGIRNEGVEIPAIVVEPKPDEWPKRSKQKKEFLKEIKSIAKAHELTREIEHFYLQKKFPVDVRHNAKIHRLTLKKKFSK